MGILLGTFILFCGIGAGLLLGRVFCKQHHKGEDIDADNCCQDGTCADEGGCSPGCCGDE